MSNKCLLTACTLRNDIVPVGLYFLENNADANNQSTPVQQGNNGVYVQYMERGKPLRKYFSYIANPSNLKYKYFSGESSMRIKEFQLEFLFLPLS